MQNTSVIAMIIAGGSGARMNQDIPKQFLNVYDKPVIIYTLEAFQKHPHVDNILVVCLDGWHEILRAYCKQFAITKLIDIVSGGKNGQDSIRNGVYTIQGRYHDQSIVMVHDAIRPMISEEIISDCIRVCSEHGNAVAVIPCAEVILCTTDGITSNAQISRDQLRRTQTPQAFKLGELVQVHQEALQRGIKNSVASCSMYIELGRKLNFSVGSEKNVKLTTPEDIDVFKALLRSSKVDWLH